MTTESFWRLQQALYTTLTNTAPLTAIVGTGGVYDHVPKAATYPYVAFGDITLRPFDTQLVNGFDATFTLHCFSRYAGNKEAQSLAGIIYAALHDQDLLISGHVHVLTQHLETDIALEGDGETRRATQQYRIVFETV